MMPRSRTRSVSSATWSSTILRMSSRESRSKITVSSTRFRNSGLKVVDRTSSIWPRTFSSSASAAMNCEPTFEVMISTELVKLTVRPWPSVSRPSSMIWSRTLKTSGWAFSISSSKITAYGRRRTASVSWPPSSKPT